MKEIICRNQVEFDKAIKENNALIILKDTTEKIIIHVPAWENASVVARGNASVAARGNASVVAWENASVVARGNASVVAWENSNAKVFDNAHALVIDEFDGRNFKTYGNGTVKRWIEQSYEKSVLDLFEKENGKQVLYKVVDPKTFCGFHQGGIKYEIGNETVAPDFDPDPGHECGGGLHLCLTPLATRSYGRGKILKCLAAPEDIVIYSKNIEKVRCRAVTPVAEVGLNGKEAGNG